MSKTKTVVFDLETINTIAGIERKWQMDIIKNLSGGIPAGTMNVFSAGRQTGKSMIMKVMKNRYYGAAEKTFWTDTNLCNEIMLPLHPTQKPKYQFSRAKWFEAPRPGHAAWNTFSNEYHDILNWCVENFGPHPKRPDAWSRWHMGVETVVFRDEKDYMLYQLKWA